MATAAQLRELRRKHHLGEFRTGYTKKRTKAKRTGGNMAKRHFKRGKGLKTGGLWKNIVGVGGYIVFEAIGEPILAQWIPNQYLDVAELGLGIWLSKKGGIVGDVAKAAIYINSYTLLKKYISPMVTSGVNNAIKLWQ